jgi:replication factor A1
MGLNQSKGFSRTGGLINILELRPGMENVTVRVKVLSVGKPRVIETKKGTRTINNAIVGDNTGRVEAVLWGEKTSSLREGDVVEISGAWVTEFKGKVQLNVGKTTSITKLPENVVQGEIPEKEPSAPSTPRQPPRRFPPRRPRSKRGEGYE